MFNPQSLPQYRSHKLVRAAEIIKVQADQMIGYCEILLEGGHVVELSGPTRRRVLDALEVMRYGYDGGSRAMLIAYSDGYISVSPLATFEAGYTRLHDRAFEPGKAPRITEADVVAAISKVDYTLLPDGRTTVCTLTLDNGFTVRGESSCVCAENFDEQKGKDIALANARGEMWKFLGFRLADALHFGTLP